MLLRTYLSAANRWRKLKDEADRGDSPVPTVIMWIGIAVVAVGLITWVGLYVTGTVGHAPNTPNPAGPPAPNP
jgi:hypothetical protein